MLLFSSPPNEWPQNINHIDDPKPSLNSNNPNMASLAATTPTIAHQDHHQQKQQQIPQEALRCPRCDSANTKFCYYNNYSLSQPRHFCKACKRYWTRGGTLRNVPVGGGCKKNKRVRRPSNNNTSSSSTNNNSASLEGSVNSASSSIIAGGCGSSYLSSSGGPMHDLLSSASNHLFYGSPTANHSPTSDISFPFSRYDLQNPPQINGLGLGFSSGLVHNMNSMNIHNTNNKQIFQDLISSNPLLSNYATPTSTTTTPTNTTTKTPTISSFLASNSLNQMKGGNNNNFQTLLSSYEDDLHMKGSGIGGMYKKEVKMEFQGQNRSSINHHHHWETTNTSTTTQNQMDPHQPTGSSLDPSILWGSSTGANLGAWLDPSNNLGSSVPSLI